MWGFTWLVLLSALAGCGPSFDDHIVQLDGGGDDQIRARQELMLAKHKVVAPLIQALEDPRYTAQHPGIVEVLVDLMTRLEDESIAAALRRHLLSNPDSRVRSRICFAVGLYNREEFADAFMGALRDTSSVVVGQAMEALRGLGDKLSEARQDSLTEAARQSLNDADLNLRLQSEIIVAQHTNVWLREANKERLKGQTATAESLYHEALAFSPESERASLGLGLLYLENGEESRGLQVLRESDWLVDVPRVSEGPTIDGHLDDEVWDRAAKIGPFFLYAMHNDATISSEYPTEISVLYTDEAVYFAAYCEEAHPESLVVLSQERDHEEAHAQDVIEIFIDPDFDREDVSRSPSTALEPSGMGSEVSPSVNGIFPGMSTRKWPHTWAATTGPSSTEWR